MDDAYLKEAKDNVPMEFAPDAVNKNLWEEICQSEPSDEIYLNWKEDDALCALWEKDISMLEHVPSDIFFAKTIPLMDCIITVDETDKFYEEQKKHGEIVNCRVVIFENYKKCDSMSNDDASIVGAEIINFLNGKLIFPIMISKGVDWIFTGNPGFHDIFLQDRNRMRQMLSQFDMAKWMEEWLVTWYGLQIALLHPITRKVFQRPKNELIYSTNQKSGKNRRKTRYIKKHIIKAGDIEDALNETDQKHNKRKTMVWYVIGHWRHYKDGKMVFVKPYWKGPLRELKQNIDTGREREIAIGDGI